VRYLIIILSLFLMAADISGTVMEADRLLGTDLSTYPGIMPTEGRVTSEYGFRRDPFTRRIRMHNGLDICNVRGTVIRAVGAGTVVFVGVQDGYGRTIIVRHSDKLTVLYAHLLTYGVSVGDKVKRGQPIACMGCTGTRSTGFHVHYETRLNGMAVDPRRFIVP
jgi:murein DD-endopeptidase MepM/ murein hydrolase activator NlpD